MPVTNLLYILCHRSESGCCMSDKQRRLTSLMRSLLGSDSGMRDCYVFCLENAFLSIHWNHLTMNFWTSLEWLTGFHLFYQQYNFCCPPAVVFQNTSSSLKYATTHWWGDTECGRLILHKRSFWVLVPVQVLHSHIITSNLSDPVPTFYIQLALPLIFWIATD